MNINRKMNDINRIIAKKHWFRRLFLIFAVVICINGITAGLNYLLVQREEWNRFLFYHFYHREEAIDNLFLGSSHVYCDVNPDIMDELTGKKNFNLSTGNQTFVESYLLLQEADKMYNIQTVYLEMYYGPHVKEETYCLSQYFRTWDYVKSSFLKHQLIMEQNPGNELPAVYFPFIRYNKYIFDDKHILSQIETKSSDGYKNLCYEKIKIGNGSYTFEENGHYKFEMSLDEKELKWNRTLLPQEPLLEEAYTYLIKIIEYCKENQIELVLFSSPTSDLQVYSTDGYDNYVKQINEIATTYDLKYYDFNLCKEEYLPIQQIEYFYDIEHLNAEGAKLFTPVLHDVITNDRKDYFYDSYKEKTEKTTPTVYGLTRDEVWDDKTTYEIASNRDTELEYRIEFIPYERATECEVIQEYDRNKKFTYENEAVGYFLVSVRLVGETEPFRELRVYNN